MTTRRMLGGLVAAGAVMAAVPALAQNKPVRIVVAFAPGGPVDAVARVIAPRLAAALAVGTWQVGLVLLALAAVLVGVGLLAPGREPRPRGRGRRLAARLAPGLLGAVSVDDVLGGRIAVEHLIDRGHQRVAFVGGPSTIGQVRERLQGAREVWAEFGLPEEDLINLPTEALSVSEGRSAGERLAGHGEGIGEVELLPGTAAERRHPAIQVEHRDAVDAVGQQARIHASLAGGAGRQRRRVRDVAHHAVIQLAVLGRRMPFEQAIAALLVAIAVDEAAAAPPKPLED